MNFIISLEIIKIDYIMVFNNVNLYLMTEFVNTDKPAITTDFYSHVNWDWLQSNPIPSEYTKWGNFNVLREENQFRLREMLETAAETEEQKKLNILWSQGMDDNKLNNQPHTRVKSLYTKFKLEQSPDTFIVELMKFNLCYLFDISAYTDFKESTRNVLYFDVAGLGLPDRDYYLNDKMKDKQDQYKEFLGKFITHFELDASVESIYAFEEQIAKVRLSKTERRDPTKIYNVYTWNQLVEEFPGINW